MSKFFIRRPIVAIVIAILTVVIGVVSMLTLADLAVSRTSFRPRFLSPRPTLARTPRP